MKKTAVVTTGTAGIGLETALGLAAAGFSVTMVGRDADRGARAIDRIDATGPAHPARFLRADLASLDEVRVLAERITADQAASGEPLTVLVNNVGAMFTDRQDLDGVEAVVRRQPPLAIPADRTAAAHPDRQCAQQDRERDLQRGRGRRGAFAKPRRCRPRGLPLSLTRMCQKRQHSHRRPSKPQASGHGDPGGVDEASALPAIGDIVVRVVSGHGCEGHAGLPAR